MKQTKIIIGIILVASMTWTSCSNEFLNTEPQDRISSDATWADGALSEAFIFNVYASLGLAGFEEQALAAYTDEAMFTHSGRNINTFTDGAETATNLAWFSETYQWGSMYLAIRKANIAIAELPNSTFSDDVLRDRLMGEARFLRAYYYHQLLRFYGGVPLIDTPLGLDDELSVARNTFEENVNFIIADLDAAASLLDGKDETPGRATRIAAMALKSRVLLYAASDLHDATASAAVLSGYSNPELVAYTSGDQNTRMLAAQSAALAVLNATSGYKLNLTAPATAAEGQANYTAMAMGGGSATSDAGAAVELLFQRTSTSQYTVESDWPLGGLHYGVNNGPNGYHNWAGNTPIQQLVDDYEMMDGTQFDWANPTHAADPYANRDPRFYATVLYDGADWKPRPSDVAPIDPVDQVQTGTYDDGSGGVIPGVDTRESPIENWNGSRTHYYTRKFIDPDPGVIDNLSNTQNIPWPFIRYTEIVLNYIEASIAVGDETPARDWLNLIRYRAGMPATAATGTDLLDLYRNERRIELVYEEHRYHDARRWLIAPTTVGRGIEIVEVRATLKTGATAHTPYRHDKAVYDYTYTVVDNTENEVRTWDDKMYYRPIARDELNKNALLVQNPGYDTN